MGKEKDGGYRGVGVEVSLGERRVEIKGNSTTAHTF